MKYARTTFVALAGAAALAITFAVGPISAQAASGGAPATATRLISAQEVTQLKLDHPGVTPDEAEVCFGEANEPEYTAGHVSIIAVAYIDDCLGTPTLCTSRADLQGKPSNGKWANIKTGATESGCNEAHGSINTTVCVRSQLGWTYRTWAAFKVVWPDGGVDKESEVSGATANAAYVC